MSAPSHATTPSNGTGATEASFAVVGSAKKPDLGRFVDLLRSALGRAHVAETPAADEADLVINVVD